MEAGRSGEIEGARRLEEVEIKLAYAEDLLETLNRTVFRQQQQIDQLVHALAALRAQLQAGATQRGADAREDVPPHY